MTKYLCIHGHFYQPPRENPWLEAIENQSSAKPYHDWNERINEECYAANSASRILNDAGKITDITNNYAKISFNFGPTLLSWIKAKHPDLLQALYEADKASQQQFGGHGNALAQAYNHLIMPLANSQDKYTQLYWGIKDFEYYFQRKPEGLWLPETAVDLETLDMMSELGIQFTILAPHQAKQIRPLDQDTWTQELSINRPYIQKLPSGREITLFFYEGRVAQAVAFEKLLIQGEEFAHRLLAYFPEHEEGNSLIHIATDGETYGHHHSHGDMGLAYALHYIEQQQDIKLTNYAQFREIQAPEHEVEIHENSSWSCIHGIERWRSDCGCNTGKGWHQQWREPLRNALDWLRDILIPQFEQHTAELVQDPWAARNEYIDVIHDRERIEAYLQTHCKKQLRSEEKKTLLQWMELQRHAMLMYTSCGWFFDELSGIETIQIIKYAARVIQLAKELTGYDYEPQFLEQLAQAPSNIAEYENGTKLYQLFVKPQCINLLNVSAHLAASLPFTNYEDQTEIYCYTAELQNTRPTITGKEQLITGHFLVKSKITWETLKVWYAVFYQGDQNLICAIKMPEDHLLELENNLHETFNKGDNFALIKLFESTFGPNTLSLRELFYDVKLKIMQEIWSSSLADLESSEQQFFENNAPLINFIADLNLELPQAMLGAFNSLINREIILHLSAETIAIDTLITLFEKAKRFNLTLDAPSIAYRVNKLLKANANLLDDKINDKAFLDYLMQLVLFIKQIPIAINLWHLQNKVYKLFLNNQQIQANSLIRNLATHLDLEVH